MFNAFTEDEKRVATELVQKALDKASASLTTLVKHPVKVDALNFGILNILKGLPEIGLEDSQDITVLKNEIVGDIPGTSILTITNADVSKLSEVCLPPGKELGDGMDRDLMTDELLKEIDNIVSAAVTSEFANELNIDLRGGIPALYVFSPQKLKSFVTKELSSYEYVLHFKANLKISSLEITPDFIWILEKSFIHRIKKIRNKVVEGSTRMSLMF